MSQVENPRSPEEYAGYRLVRVADQMSRRFAVALTPTRLTPRQFSVLAALAAAPDQSSAELARAVLTTPQGMHLLIQQLEDRGLIERQATRGRGRVAPIRLTEHGQGLLQEATPLIDGLEMHTRERLGDDRYNTLLALLTSLDERPVD